ncbi:MAG: KEOPS complex subunit Pcc1 [Candidatus Hadarchaeales archaeon]
MRARLELSFPSARRARSIAESIKPDNIRVPLGMRIRTEHLNRSVITEIELEGNIKTLLSTLDDLLACIGTAEDMTSVG